MGQKLKVFGGFACFCVRVSVCLLRGDERVCDAQLPVQFSAFAAGVLLTSREALIDK